MGRASWSTLLASLVLSSACSDERSSVKPYNLPPELSVDVHAERGPQGEIYLVGSTNFPDGMKMWVHVESGPAPVDAFSSIVSKVIAYDDAVTIRNSRFRTSALWSHVRNPFFSIKWLKVLPNEANRRFRNKALASGDYKVRLIARFSGGWQTQEVITALGGEGGKKLRGTGIRSTDADVSDSDKELYALYTVPVPPLSSEAKAIILVKGAVLTVPGRGRSAIDIEGTIADFMVDPAIHPAKGWSARVGSEGTYEVVFDFINGKAGEEQAIWTADLKTGQVKYVNTSAKSFSWTPDY